MKNFHSHIFALFILFNLISHNIQSQSISFFPDTIYTCPYDTIKLSIPSDIFSKSASIQWITPYAIIYHSSTLLAYQEGKYTLKIRNKNSEISDSVVIIKSPVPKYLINDTTLCTGKFIIIKFIHPQYKFYLPNTTSNIQQLKINQSGTYTITISNNGCKINETFTVKPIYPTIPEHNEYTFCMNDENKKITLKYNGISTIEWSNGSEQKYIIPDKEGDYWVKISDKYCGSYIDTIHVKMKPCNCEILIPNSFTPNEDGKNDFFYPILSCDYSYYNLIIYDKWNNVVFSTNNPNAKWDGKYKGNLLPEDVYVYKLETIEKNSDKKNIRTGKIILTR